MAYRTMSGAITSVMLTGSTVGVMAAATTAMMTTAWRQKPSSLGPLTMPARARKATTSGISNATPIQKTMRVTKLI